MTLLMTLSSDKNTWNDGISITLELNKALTDRGKNTMCLQTLTVKLDPI